MIRLFCGVGIVGCWLLRLAAVALWACAGLAAAHAYQHRSWACLGANLVAGASCFVVVYVVGVIEKDLRAASSTGRATDS